MAGGWPWRETSAVGARGTSSGNLRPAYARTMAAHLETLIEGMHAAHLDADDHDHLVGEFEEHVFPVLTPLAVDPGHPFPYISNLSLNLAVLVRDPVTGERRFARVKVPDLLPRFVVMPDGERYVPLEQLIAAHLHVLFPGRARERHRRFRV